MRSAGKVISRDDLMEHLYNRKATAFDRSVDMHVSHLRKKLETGRPLIKTIRGAGYQFCRTAEEMAEEPREVAVRQDPAVVSGDDAGGVRRLQRHRCPVVTTIPCGCRPWRGPFRFQAREAVEAYEDGGSGGASLGSCSELQGHLPIRRHAHRCQRPRPGNRRRSLGSDSAGRVRAILSAGPLGGGAQDG